MKVIKQIILSKEDIQKIIAERFNVDKSKVEVEPYVFLDGYYMDEHYSADVKVHVNIPEDIPDIESAGKYADQPVLQSAT